MIDSLSAESQKAGDVMLQVIIGISVALAGTIALAIFHKLRRKVWIGVSACTAAALAGSIVCMAAEFDPFDTDSGTYLFSEDSRSSSDSSSHEEIPADYLDIIRYLMQSGRVNEAQKLLHEYGENYEYDDNYLSLIADVYDATGCPERAVKLRNALGIDAKPASDDEIKENSSSDIDESDDLPFAPSTPGKKSGKDNDKDDDDETISDISSVKLNKKASSAAKAYQAICELSDYQNGNYYISDTTELYRCIKDWADSEYPYSGLPSLKRAQLASELYLHNYNDIARNVMNDPDSDSLIVASQLVRKGSISNSGSKSFFDDEQLDDAEKVLELLEDELDKGSYSDEDLEYLDQKADTLSKTMNGKADLLEIIIEKMEQEAPNDVASAAKLYLELADISYSKGDNAAASKYLEKCLKYAALSSDAEFSSIVDQINRMVFRTNDPEARKQLSSYVQKMEDNRMPENIPPIDTTILDSAAAMDQSSKPDKQDDTYDDDFNSPAIPGFDPQNYSGSKHDSKDEDDDYDDDSNTPDDGSETPETPVNDRSLTENVTDSLNQMVASVNILSINTDQFPALTAVVSADESLVSTADEFKEHMKLTDAGAAINDYTVEKVEYSNVNVVLVCDDSGSMDGSPRNDLCEAVKSFVNNADSNVKIGMVPFASGVKTDHVAPLGSSKTTLCDNADALCADGGTNIYDAVVYANSMFTNNDTDLNIMILMSDGQDSAPSPERLEELNKTCLDRNISIYTVGLGSGADANLLKMYSDYCNGAYFYVNSSESINSFYNFIFTLGKNRYKLSFDAVDTFQIDRLFEVSYDDSPSIRDEQEYTLFRNDLIGKENGGCDVSIGNVVINGLKEKMIYPSSLPQDLTLLGAGFEKDAEMSAELHGADTYPCTVEYIDENSAKFTIPGNVPVGIYDVYVTYNGRRAVFNSGLVVSSGDTNVVRFGEYIFTATNIDYSGSSTILSGVVQLNGWLGFTDAVTLTGDLANDYSIRMDYGRTYIHFTDTSAGGLAGYFAKKGYMLKLPYPGSVTLYNDQTTPGSSDNYPVSSAPVYDFTIIDLLSITGNTAGVSIYPDRAVINFNEFSSAFPFQGKVVSTFTDGFFHYSLNDETNLTYGKDRIDLCIDVELGNNRSKDDMIPLKIGNANIYTSLGSAKLKIDTSAGIVDISATANIAMLVDGVGLEIATKDWKLDKIMLMCDKDINTTICNVPVTFSDFKLGVQDLSKIDTSKGWTDIFAAELVGACDVSLAKVSAYCPGLEKYVGDVSFASLDDFTLGLRLKEFRIRAETKVKFLGIAEVGSAKLQLGMGLEYENPLFVIQHEANGIIGELEKGLKIDEDNFLLEFTGKQNLALTDQAVGLWVNGHFHAKIGWWVFVADKSADGNAYIGWYRQQNDKMAFAVLANGHADNKNVSFQVVWGENDTVFSSHKF